PSSRFVFMQDSASLLDGFQATGEHYTVAARVRGKLKSAYPNGRPDGDESDADENDETDEAQHLAETTEDANLIIVADTDLLSDPLWIRTQSQIGRASCREKVKDAKV